MLACSQCDEVKPRCQRCLDSDANCEYALKTPPPDSRLVERLAFPKRTIDGRTFPSTAQYDMSLALTAASLDALLQPAGDLPNHLRSGGTSYVHILQHFETVTYATTGSPVVQEVAKAGNLKFAMMHPFLIHATLAFAAAHLKCPLPFSANPMEYRRNAIAKAYHWQRASHLFRKELNSPRPRLPKHGPHSHGFHASRKTVLPS
jgi:hypothetical protein